MPEAAEADPFDVRLARRAPRVLRQFNAAGVLDAADVHVALRLHRLGGADEGDKAGEAGEAVLLATALAVRAPRLGHVCTDLATIRTTATIDVELPVDLQALPWPDPEDWARRVAASPLVASGEGDGTPDGHPLRLVGTRLYLDRYWREERQVAVDLRSRAAQDGAGVDTDVLTRGLDRLFAGPDPDHQRLAGASAVLRRFSVVAGGPGTGKTTTVARVLALLLEQAEAAGSPPPLVALAAPTGKAAARLEEAVHEEASRLDVSSGVRDRLLATGASTLHRLLGWRPGNRSRFRHDRGNRLPHEVVVVDEMSMVSLSLMAKLVEAVRADARLVLIGDPEQLASVEAGAVLGDVVGPAADGLLMRPPARQALAEASGHQVRAEEPPAGTAIGDGIVVLRHVHRFGGGIAQLAEAVRRGDAGAVVDVLGGDTGDVHWIPADVGETPTTAALRPVRAAAVDAGRRVTEAARAGEARAAIEALAGFRLLCAHRRGPHGVSTWMGRVESWLAAEIDGFAAGGTWYVGRPLLVTENDYGLRLYNGDTGVVVAAAADRVAAVFERRGELLELGPTRLAAVDTVYAMTVHKSQGSQFDTVAVLLPDPASPILTRELLYTAVTRARRRLILAGTAETVTAAIERPIARASGLRRRLWEEEAPAGG
ncbi:MAG: exodeoxyribonuclease V subunit alpha [Actinobacteria bacterium]|nr:exodeoxyribonuclease V subunit alpha [Actinomycetota bacterium]